MLRLVFRIINRSIVIGEKISENGVRKGLSDVFSRITIERFGTSIEYTPMLILVSNRSIVMGEKTSENPFRTPFSDIFSPITIERLIIPKTSINVGVKSFPSDILTKLS